jgi:hypothetical protein
MGNFKYKGVLAVAFCKEGGHTEVTNDLSTIHLIDRVLDVGPE